MNPRLRKRILSALNRAPNTSLDEEQLVEACNPPWTRTEALAEARRMEADEMLVITTGPVEDRHYTLTPGGSAAAAIFKL